MSDEQSVYFEAGDFELVANWFDEGQLGMSLVDVLPKEVMESPICRAWIGGIVRDEDWAVYAFERFVATCDGCIKEFNELGREGAIEKLKKRAPEDFAWLGRENGRPDGPEVVQRYFIGDDFGMKILLDGTRVGIDDLLLSRKLETGREFLKKNPDGVVREVCACGPLSGAYVLEMKLGVGGIEAVAVFVAGDQNVIDKLTYRLFAGEGKQVLVHDEKRGVEGRQLLIADGKGLNIFTEIAQGLKELNPDLLLSEVGQKYLRQLDDLDNIPEMEMVIPNQLLLPRLDYGYLMWWMMEQHGLYELADPNFLSNNDTTSTYVTKSYVDSYDIQNREWQDYLLDVSNGSGGWGFSWPSEADAKKEQAEAIEGNANVIMNNDTQVLTDPDVGEPGDSGNRGGSGSSPGIEVTIMASSQTYGRLIRDERGIYTDEQVFKSTQIIDESYGWIRGGNREQAQEVVTRMILVEDDLSFWNPFEHLQLIRNQILDAALSGSCRIAYQDDGGECIIRQPQTGDKDDDGGDGGDDGVGGGFGGGVSVVERVVYFEPVDEIILKPEAKRMHVEYRETPLRRILFDEMQPSMPSRVSEQQVRRFLMMEKERDNEVVSLDEEMMVKVESGVYVPKSFLMDRRADAMMGKVKNFVKIAHNMHYGLVCYIAIINIIDHLNSSLEALEQSAKKSIKIPKVAMAKIKWQVGPQVIRVDEWIPKVKAKRERWDGRVIIDTRAPLFLTASY